jgi:short-subunit dehydrogenase involved in D-alanine esterification of teichoic acids
MNISGNTVIVGGRRGAELELVSARHPGLDTVQIDTTDPASISSAAKQVLDRQSEPDAKEILVERVKFLRYGEARGDYDQVVKALNASDPHGK